MCEIFCKKCQRALQTIDNARSCKTIPEIKHLYSSDLFAQRLALSAINNDNIYDIYNNNNNNIEITREPVTKKSKITNDNIKKKQNE